MTNQPPSKRRRGASRGDQNRPEAESSSSETQTLNAGPIMPFPCLQEPENMIPNQITEYMDGLPPLTQYCDLRGLYNLLPQDARDWKDYVIQWQDLRGRRTDYVDVVNNPPEFPRHASAPPISKLKPRLRAVVTYKDLLIKAQERDLSAEIKLALANKLLDYLVLCFEKAHFAEMEGAIPEWRATWNMAVEAISALGTGNILNGEPAPATNTHGTGNILNDEHGVATHSHAIDNILTDNKGVQPTLQTASGSAVEAKTANGFEDVDCLKLDTLTAEQSSKEWEKIAGNKLAKHVLFKAVVAARLCPHLFPDPANLLLFGASGTGKTMMIKCLAGMSDRTTFQVSIASLKGKYPGESEEKLTRIFHRAKESSPSIIFFEDVDALMATRTDSQTKGVGDLSSCLRNILIDVTDAKAQIWTIATTNRPHAIDDAFLRRFPRRVYVQLPDVSAVLTIIETQLRKYEHDPFLDTAAGRVELDKLAGTCMKKRSLSGDDIVLAMDEIGRTKESEVADAKSFDEHTHDGQQVLYPCAKITGTIKRKFMELDPIDIPRIRFTRVQLSDIATALAKVRTVLSPRDIQDLDDWNSWYGTK